MAAKSPKTILALDVGDARIGVAAANSAARLPSPLVIVENNEQVFENLIKLIKEQQAEIVVIGLPRNLSGEETGQSKTIRVFSASLKEHIQAEIVFADESLSSKRAEDYAAVQGLKTKYLDDIAACFILEEYFRRENG